MTSFFHTQVTTHWFNTPVRVEYLIYALVPKSNHADATKGLSVKTSKLTLAKHSIGSLLMVRKSHNGPSYVAALKLFVTHLLIID